MSSGPQVQPSKSKWRLKQALSEDGTHPYLGTPSEPLIINASADDRGKKWQISETCNLAGLHLEGKTFH